MQTQNNSAAFLFSVSLSMTTVVLFPPIILAAKSPLTSTVLPATGRTLTVNSTADEPDIDSANGICAGVSGNCTLRAAIMESNFTVDADTIILPVGIYTLTRAGDDDAALIGDLDITAPLKIQGAGSTVAIVDGNGVLTGDRVFQVLASAKDVTLSGLTILNGQKTASAFDQGGGLYWDGAGGSHLTLGNVVIANNTASYSGGLQLNFSALGDFVELGYLAIQGNTATAAAGGLGVNLADFATFNLHNSKIELNQAYQGGGIYLQDNTTAGLTSVGINNSLILDNTASLSGGVENHSGNATVPVIIQNSNLSQNHANFYGGAIGNYGTLKIINSTMDANTGEIRGGGIFTELFIHNTAGVTATNTTISDNVAAQDGGGIYAQGGQIELYNTTVAANHILVPTGVSYSGLGGGDLYRIRG